MTGKGTVPEIKQDQATYTGSKTLGYRDQSRTAWCVNQMPKMKGGEEKEKKNQRTAPKKRFEEIVKKQHIIYQRKLIDFFVTSLRNEFLLVTALE